MNARIANFQLLWDATVLPPPPLHPPPLVRCDNRHHLLPQGELERFWTATPAERAKMMHLNEIRLRAAEIRRAAGIYTQEELDNLASWDPSENNSAGDAERVPAPLIVPADPLDYYDEDADDPYDLDLAAY
jgi:hypothetical protein